MSPSRPPSSRAPRVALVGTPELVTFPRFAESLHVRGAEVVPVDPMDLALLLDGDLVEPAPIPDLDPAGLAAFYAPVAGARSPIARSVIEHWERAGIPTLNPAAAKALSVDKAATSATLAAAGIPAPHSVVVDAGPWGRESRARLAAKVGFPIVVKGRTGSLGREVFLAHDAERMEAIIAELAVPADDGVILQHFYAEAGARDFRIIVLEAKVIAVKARWSGRDDEFRSAMPGYVATVGEISADEEAIAIAATRALGLDYAGVDLMRTNDGPRVIEMNHNPFLATTERVTGVDIAGAVADALLARARRVG